MSASRAGKALAHFPYTIGANRGNSETRIRIALPQAKCAGHVTPPPVTLSNFILENVAAILVEWEQFARTIPAAAAMDTAALRDHAEAILKAIAHDIAQPQSDAQQKAKSQGKGSVERTDSAAETHSGVRHAEGFSLNDMVSEYRALRASVIRLWIHDMSSADRDTLYQLTRFNEAMDQALSESIARYSSQLDRSRELFLGVLGHDLRTPLGAILNSAEYLLLSNALSGVQTKAVSLISGSGKRLQAMISDLLDVARTRLGAALPLAPKQLDLLPVCRQVLDEENAHHPDHEIRFSTAGDLQGMWDEARLSQMLSNLVENAIRHGAADKPVTVTASGEADHVALQVHNEGVPIPQAARARIFEPLTQAEPDPIDQRKAGGLGLGLYIARAIAQAHGGTIEVESSREQGTTFTARLPRRLPNSTSHAL